MKVVVLDRKDGYRGFAFAVATMLIVTAAAALPMPLFALYQRTMGLSNSDISVAMFLYLAAITLTLLFGGRVTDALGRKAGLAAALALAMVGCVMFAFAQNAQTVFAARFCQGVSIALSMSAVAAYGVDCIRHIRLSWGSALASCGVLVGLMVGSLAMGLFADSVDSARMVYAGVAVLAALGIAALARAPETVQDRKPLTQVVRPKLAIPREAVPVFVGTFLAYTAVWGIAAYYQSFASTFAATYFGETNPMASSLVLSAVLAPSALGGPIVSRVGICAAQRGGIVATVASGALMLACADAALFVPFMGVCFLFGVAMGACLTASLQNVLLGVSSEENSATISMVNLFAYGSISILSVLSAAVATVQSLAFILALHVVLALVCAPAIFLLSRRRVGAPILPPQASR